MKCNFYKKRLSENRLVNLSYKFCYYLILTVFWKSTYAQFEQKSSVVSPSPNVSSATKGINTPVNMYTGLPNINIDLYTLKGRDSYNIPVSISYNSGGHKVQDVASNIGLGWSLSSDFMISRVVRGLPDEDYYGYSGDVSGAVTRPLSPLAMAQYFENKSDGEPDLFYYRLNGISGKFVIDKDKNPVILQNNGVVILNSPFKKEQGIDGWVLADLSGNKYYLGTDLSTIEQTKSKHYFEKLEDNKEYTFTSTWYIKNIITANNTNDIQFNYSTGNETKVVYHEKRKKIRETYTSSSVPGNLFHPDIRSNSTTLVENTWNGGTEDTFVSPKYLTSIITDNEKIYFHYDTQQERKDLANGRVMSEIEVKNYSGEKLVSFNFLHEYLYSNDKERLKDLINSEIASISRYLEIISSPSNVWYDEEVKQTSISNRASLRLLLGTFNLWSEEDLIQKLKEYTVKNNRLFSDAELQPGLQEQDRYRLRLNGIVKYSTDNSESIPLYRFVYDDAFKLPPRNSYKTDDYGFYNNNTVGYFPPSLTIDENYKNSDKDRMKAGILKRIIYDTGGYKEFVFEAKEYFDTKKNSNEIAGGLRIAKILDVPGYDNAPVVTTYNYRDNAGRSTGKLIVQKPVYISYLEHNQNQAFKPPVPAMEAPSIPVVTQMRGDLVLPVKLNPINLGAIIGGFINSAINTVQSTSYSPFIMQSSNVQGPLLDIDGINVGYSEVSVSNPDGGKTVNLFTDITEYPDESNQLRVDKSFITVTRLSPNVAPYTPTTSYAFARGFLKQSLVYNKNSELVKKIVNNYVFSDNTTSIRGFRCSPTKAILRNDGTFLLYDNESSYDIGYYEFIAKSLLLSSSTEQSWEEGSISPSLRTVSYNHNPQYPSLLRSYSTTESDEKESSIEFKYVINRDEVNYQEQYQRDAASQLYTDGRYGLLLEKVIKSDDMVVSVSKTGFKTWSKNNSLFTAPEIIYNGNTYGSLRTIRQCYDYDQYGNLVESSDLGGPKAVTKWGYAGLFPVAECSNAGMNQIYIQDFEDGTINGTVSGEAHTGLKYFSGDYTTPFILQDNRSYKISYWYNEGGTWKYSGKINYTGPMTLNAGDAIDDIVILPDDAQASLYTYGAAGMTSVTNSKNLSSFYSYDKFNRISLIRDNNGDIVRHFAYNQPGSVVSQVFFNNKASRSFTKTGCYKSFGEAVTYEIPENKYFSYISQQDADQKASADLDANGQQFANSTGKCLIYARVEAKNPRWVNESYYYKRVVDLSIHFYADAALSIPATANQEMDVNLGFDYVWTDGNYNSESYSDYTTYTVTAGTSVINLGPMSTEGIHNYRDPITNQEREEYFGYTYYVKAAQGSGYVPASTL